MKARKSSNRWPWWRRRLEPMFALFRSGEKLQHEDDPSGMLQAMDEASAADIKRMSVLLEALRAIEVKACSGGAVAALTVFGIDQFANGPARPMAFWTVMVFVVGLLFAWAQSGIAVLEERHRSAAYFDWLLYDLRRTPPRIWLLASRLFDGITAIATLLGFALGIRLLAELALK